VDWIHLAQDRDWWRAFGFHMRRVISRLNERLLASHEEFSCMDFSCGLKACRGVKRILTYLIFTDFIDAAGVNTNSMEQSSS
jgi:hypothetical protein